MYNYFLLTTQLTLQLLNNNIPDKKCYNHELFYNPVWQGNGTKLLGRSSPLSQVSVRAHLIHWKLRDAKHSAWSSWIWESWAHSQVLHSSLSSTSVNQVACLILGIQQRLLLLALKVCQNHPWRRTGKVLWCKIPTFTVALLQPNFFPDKMWRSRSSLFLENEAAEEV